MVFTCHLSYWVQNYAWGYQAIDPFHNGLAATDESPDFEPIAEALKSSSIRKRYYINDSGEHTGVWDVTCLLVLDEHDQMWGFVMDCSQD